MGKVRAVLAPADDLAADADDPLFPGVQVIGEVAVVFVAVGLGHQHLHVLADRPRGGVAEDPLGRRVERFDGPVLVDGDDAIHGGVDDRPDPVPALEQLLLHPLQRGDVGERDHHPLDPVLLGAVRQHLADVPQVLRRCGSLWKPSRAIRGPPRHRTPGPRRRTSGRCRRAAGRRRWIRLISWVAAGVNCLMQKWSSRKIVAMFGAGQ